MSHRALKRETHSVTRPLRTAAGESACDGTSLFEYFKISQKRIFAPVSNIGFIFCGAVFSLRFVFQFASC